jgi:hypothetical protein
MKRKPKKLTETKRRASPRVPHHRSGAGDASQNNRFGVEVRIRGEVGYLYRETCAGLEDAARIGRMHFVAFDARNPWLVQDSVQRRISFCSILKQRLCESNTQEEPGPKIEALGDLKTSAS